jgi:hypothetical protein
MAIGVVEPGLYSLPVESLQQIAGYLDKSHRPSLYAFGMASKTCRGAIIPLILYQIYFLISSPEVLRRDVEALIKILSRTESSRYVRCLTIKGSLSLLPGERIVEGRVVGRVEGNKSGSLDRHSFFEKTGINEILSDEEPYTTAPHVVYDEPVIQKSSDEDLAWSPLVGLITTLPCLSKLVYDCQNQFPPSLLEALHNHTNYPQCKLYHLTFRFRTLLWGTPYPYEMALATSPCLYSIKVACGKRDSDGDDDFNQEALMELVAGLAPNLKEVVVVNLTPENSWRYYLRPRESWRGLPGFDHRRSGSLTSLSLLGAVDLNADRFTPPGLLQKWDRHTDFCSMRHLSLGGGYGSESIGINTELMEWIIDNCSFPRLKSLHVRLARDERPDYTNKVNAFLGAFEPLNELSVSGPLEPNIVDTFLQQHGQTLKKLSLRSLEYEFAIDNHREIPMTCTKENILQIAAQCPVLEELAVPVKRTKSDATEVDIYKTFGKMRRLTSLFLILDCSDWRVTRDPDSRLDDSFDTADRETVKNLDFLKKGHLRETLMNCAVDEELARSISEVICQSKTGQKLESLKLWTTGGGQWGNNRNNGEIPNFVDNLSCSWLIERIERDNDNDIINVRELGWRARQARDQELTRLYQRRAEYLREQKNILWEEDSETLQVFRRIWPSKEGTLDWREDWSSIPLQV